MFKRMYETLLGKGMSKSASLGGSLGRPAGSTSNRIGNVIPSAVPSGAAGRGFQTAATTNLVSFAQANSLGAKLATHLDTMGGGMQYGPMAGSYQRNSMGKFFPSSFSISGTGYAARGMGRMMGGLPNQMF